MVWCPVTQVGTLEAISNDSGLVITLHERDSLSVAPHPVMAPAFASQMQRPGAIAALRWVVDSITMKGYQSVSGIVDVSRAGTLLSGTFNMKLRDVSGVDSLLIRGSFRDLPVTAVAVGCS
jgi:hypothetical protein